MVRQLSKYNKESLHLYRNRNRLLTAIREDSLRDPEEQSRAFLFQHCCEILQDSFGCYFIWAGDIDCDTCCLVIFGSSPQTTPLHSSRQHRLAALLIEKFNCSMADFTEPVYLQTDSIDWENDSALELQWPPYCIAWPVSYQGNRYGFVVVHCSDNISVCGHQAEFFSNVIDDIAQAIYLQETARKLKIERDFNKDIVDTIQALMVTIRPCGTIISFNSRAEEVTGYREEEILEKYWVDVMILPEKRSEFQQLFAQALKGSEVHINFMAPLRTKDGQERYISWHGSIRHNIDRGTVGLVMLGIDETENLFAGRQLNILTARWEKIFIAIQDPALVVTNDSTIIEANPATFAAAKKQRSEVIGRKVCDILHGGHEGSIQCPLEQFIGYQKTQISETELHGLNGKYMLTVTPLVEENGQINTTLLLARNLTQEEVLKSEAIRASQLAAIGELASGVAHEINNPINGIINYAQIILDDPDDEENEENLENIIAEGKRIASIVSKLLDFARRREESPAYASVGKILSDSLQLVGHLLKKNGISCIVEMEENLPELKCNDQQLQQVFLNIISNARYALNERFPEDSPEKIIKITGENFTSYGQRSIRLCFTDFGTGIPQEICERIFDPFFSTKPKGEGTGLGLSISHGLISDHGGRIRVESKRGQGTTFTIDLPCAFEYREPDEQ